MFGNYYGVHKIIFSSYDDHVWKWLWGTQDQIFIWWSEDHVWKWLCGTWDQIFIIWWSMDHVWKWLLVIKDPNLITYKWLWSRKDPIFIIKWSIDRSCLKNDYGVQNYPIARKKKDPLVPVLRMFSNDYNYLDFLFSQEYRYTKPVFLFNYLEYPGKMYNSMLLIIQTRYKSVIPSSFFFVSTFHTFYLSNTSYLSLTSSVQKFETVVPTVLSFLWMIFLFSSYWWSQ